MLPRMIHTTLLVFAISVYICSVAFLYLKDFLPACNGIPTTVHFTLQMINIQLANMSAPKYPQNAQQKVIKNHHSVFDM